MSPPVVAGPFAGRYVIEHELGRGASAIVYRAGDLERGRVVAIKVLHDELAQSTASDRFLREIRRHSGLEHPRILPVLDAGDYAGQLYCVFPFMEGGTLRQRLVRERQLPIADAVAIARTIADALGYAHRLGIIHRDVKPENILFTAGQPCLADFGIARTLEHVMGDTSTSRGIVRGTVAYMSPEQASGERDYDGRSDVFSLGCVLYEMLAGVPAFIGATAEAVLAQRFTHRPRELRVYRPLVSPALEAVVSKALEMSPADRYQTASAFADALVAGIEDDRVATGDELRLSAGLQRRAWSRWQRSAATAAALLAVVAGGLAIARSLRPPFRERDWILVADFDGPRDDPELGYAVRELATAELNQSRYLSTLPRAQLSETMRLAGVPDSARVGPELARQLAYRSAVRAVLVGSITRVGSRRDTYAIVMNVVDADRGENILSATGAASDTNLITTVQRLARDVREGLGERRDAIAATLPLEQIATPSFAAYRRYAEGIRLHASGDERASNSTLREAIALDTGFASAWYTMGWNYLNDRMLDSARFAFRQALARRDRLSELQRYRLEADVAYAIDYDLPAAIRAYDLFLSHSPRSSAVHNNRGNYLIALGRYEDALASFDSAVSVHPFGPRRAQIQLMNQAATLAALGRIGDAKRVAKDLSGPFAQYMQLMMAAATDQWTDAGRLGQMVGGSPSSFSWLRQYTAAIAAASGAHRGAVRSADDALARAELAATPDAARWFHGARLLLAEAAERSAPPLPDVLAKDTSAGGVLTAALTAAVRSDTSVARAALERVRRLPASEQRRLGEGARLADAWLLAHQGRWRQVVDTIGAKAWAGEHDSSLLDRVGSLSLRWLLADAYAHIGKTDSATAALELAITPSRMPSSEFALRGLVLSFAHRRLAQWYESRGRNTEAVAHWRAFADAFSTPDPEANAMVLDARAALRRLGSR
jgi:tetratricopeptide (TPR) repeat protein/tRNA A-37 threonylcarbamoyl transferase component Bud32